MEIEMPHKRDRGQVGIGTLIVFIAMVLVAAIAAGVLINTAGFLQSQSEETGESSSEQVTNRVEVVNAVGEEINDGNVDKVTVTVKQAPGAANIDIGETIVQWTDDSGAYDLTYGSGSSTGDAPNSTAFSTDPIQDDDSSLTDGSPVLNNPSDRLALIFDVDDIHSGDDEDSYNGDGLEEGQTAELQINTQSGGTSNLILNVPQTLSGTSAVNL